MTAPLGEPGMAMRILDTAEELVQVRGFNAFSYADVATRLNITRAGLHYHFAEKVHLGEALISRYTDRFEKALHEIDASGASAPAKLAAYTALYGGVLNSNRMCLCGMLAAEYQTLAPSMRDAVVGFFDLDEAWLAATLIEGQAGGLVRLNGSPHDAANAIIGALEGAMLMARLYGDPRRFQVAAEGILASVAPTDAV